ncbi:expressed unknown protein [Seminavis robusta]|uniref:Uncharacterized protein n=1 Tax=Seminavis robusta TaxID=568900 RepID=A0A9N8F0H0_9STRA|nr:expressed unknown protein [Seminavis robusta]|eukprot:Sro2407_g326561.1  (196) ;mRNA; f:3429-4016
MSDSYSPMNNDGRQQYVPVFGGPSSNRYSHGRFPLGPVLPSAGNPAVSHSLYYAHPGAKIFSTFMEANNQMESFYAGFFGPYKLILSGGSCWLGGSKPDKSLRTQARRYKCCVEGCLWRAQIRTMAPNDPSYGSVFCLYITNGSVHNHAVSRAPPHHTDQYGLPSIAKHFAHSYIAPMSGNPRELPLWCEAAVLV